MTEQNKTQVVYEAIVDFSSLTKKAREARREVKALREEDARFNKQSAAAQKVLKTRNDNLAAYRKGVTSVRQALVNLRKEEERHNAQVTKSSSAIKQSIKDFSTLRRSTGLTRDAIKALNAEEKKLGAQKTKNAQASSRNKKALEEETQAFENAASALSDIADATNKVTGETNKFKKVKGVWHEVLDNGKLDSTTRAVRQFAAQQSVLARGFSDTDRASKKARSGLGDIFRQFTQGRSAAQTFGNGVDTVNKSLRRLSNWRPRLMPPFVALVPIIAAVVAAINPLISILGAAGAATLGFANSLASLSGVALALPGIFAGVAAGIGSMITAMSGVGSVFKAYSALKKAGTSGGGGGVTPEDRADALADAEDRVRRAQRNSKRAQDDLNKARQQALKDLIELRLEVSRASLNEERALANLQKARENYNNVLADPGSTAGDKMDALASLKEAEADLEDTRRKNAENQKALAEAEKKGVEGSDAVIDAQERLADSLREVRDAQKNLRKEQLGLNGSAGAAATAANEFQEALDKLSPSAQKFVLGLIAMGDAWTKLRKNVQESFFSQFVGDLDLIEGFLPTLENLLSKAAGAMGKFIDKGIKMVTSGPWKKDFNTLADRNVTVISNLGDALLNLLDALRHVTIAAGPFVEWMTGAFKEGTENFRDLVSSARDSGRLETWLDKVRQRLQQWWRIIKNIGATLFNYGAAASQFGDWITNGFEKITEGWRKASEEARDPNSDFAKWINGDTLKELLGELKDLFGGFFSWFRGEAMDENNMKEAIDLIKGLREELGPAIGNLFDTLAKSDIDEKFVTALTSIVDSIDKILEKGGSAGFETFFDIIVGFFEALESLVDALPPEVVKPLLQLMGAIAALSLISGFPGVSLLLTGLGNLAKNKGFFSTFFKDMKNLNGFKFTGMMSWLGGIMGLLRLLPTLGIGFGSTAPGSKDDEDKNKPGVQVKNFLGQEETYTDLNQKLKDLKNGKNASGAPQWWLDFQNWMAELFGGGSKPKQPKGVGGGFAVGAGRAEHLAGVTQGAEVKTTIQNIFGPIAPAIMQGWNVFLSVGKTIWTGITGAWNTLVGAGQMVWASISRAWNTFMGVLGGMWQRVVSVAQGVWTTLSNWWGNVVRTAQTVWNTISRWWGQVTTNANKVWSAVSRWWGDVTTNASRMWNDVSRWWGDVANTASRIWNDISRWWGDVITNAGNVFNSLSNWVGSLFGSTGGRVPKQTPRDGNTHPRSGGRPDKTPVYASKGGAIYLASGGRALRRFTGSGMRPVGTDTVPAMLTPGEFVLRRSVVDAVGVDKLARLNAGMTSYSDMLNEAMASQKNKEKEKNRTQPVSFLAGGGLAGSAAYSMGSQGMNYRASSSQSQSITVDQRTVIEQLNVHNPVAERATDSLTRTIRSINWYGKKRGKREIDE